VFAFAWLFSGWGSFSSRKLLTEKVIIAKLNRESFETKKLWELFSRFSMSIAGATTQKPFHHLGLVPPHAQRFSMLFSFRRLHSFLENDYIADFGWLDLVAIGV
jgi:hypothetical protein